jgi:hypothetical protein
MASSTPKALPLPTDSDRMPAATGTPGPAHWQGRRVAERNVTGSGSVPSHGEWTCLATTDFLAVRSVRPLRPAARDIAASSTRFAADLAAAVPDALAERRWRIADPAKRTNEGRH